MELPTARSFFFSFHSLRLFLLFLSSVQVSNYRTRPMVKGTLARPIINFHEYQNHLHPECPSFSIEIWLLSLANRNWLLFLFHTFPMRFFCFITFPMITLLNHIVVSPPPKYSLKQERQWQNYISVTSASSSLFMVTLDACTCYCIIIGLLLSFP